MNKSLSVLTLSLLLFSSAATSPGKPDVQLASLSYMDITTLALEGTAGLALAKIPVLIAHECMHSLMHKLFTGEFGAVHIGNHNPRAKPLFSIGKKFHVHGSNLNGCTELPGFLKNQSINEFNEQLSQGFSDKKAKELFITVIAGPIAGTITSLMLQGLLQAGLNYKETKNLKEAFKKGISNIINPFSAIAENKTLSYKEKAHTLIAANAIFSNTINEIVSLLFPAGAESSGSIAWKMLLKKKDLPSWSHKLAEEMENVAPLISFCYMIQAFYKAREIENKKISLALID